MRKILKFYVTPRSLRHRSEIVERRVEIPPSVKSHLPSPKDPKQMFLKFLEYSQETPVLESLFDKVAGLMAHRCFPVNIAKI